MNRILIVGAGSVGVYLGCLLHKAGHDVMLFGRKKLKQIGSSVILGNVTHEVPRKVFKLPKNENFDYVFVTSKLPDLEANLKAINQNKVNAGHIVSIQNGLVDNTRYAKYLKDKKFSSVSVFEGFRLLDNQLFHSSSNEGWKTSSDSHSREVASLLKSAGINCEAVNDLESSKAEKMLTNCALNVLAALREKTVFQLCTEPEHRDVVEKLFDEAHAVLKDDYSIPTLKEAKSRFFATVGHMHHYPSTYQDVKTNRKTEADFINGFIIRKAKQKGIPVPENEKLIQEFKTKHPKL